MITKIEAINFRCLHYINQPLKPFNILVGPNASGKTTFLEVISYLGRLISDGLEAANAPNFYDMVWQREGTGFELAVEAQIPQQIQSLYTSQKRIFDTIRYEIAIGVDPDTTEISILAEKVILKNAQLLPPVQRELFPNYASLPSGNTIITSKGVQHIRTIVNKVYGGNDNFYSEVYQESGKGWAPAFKLGPRKSALANLPEDETKFPAAVWLKNLLAKDVQLLVLNSILIRKASPPGQVRSFRPDGANLPWVINELQKRSPDQYADWIAHIQTALPDIIGIRTIEREDDKHRYLMIQYRGGLEVPSWVASDGTLRLLALTLPAYLPDLRGVFLIEEPENGIHPKAVETMFQSLSSVYEAQILLATHSPVILSLADANSVLCFAKSSDGATDIVLGSEHPALVDWRGETNLGVLFASGVLG